MTFSYDATKLDEPLNWVRLRIKDTREDDPLLQNEEINSFVAENGNLYRAAAAACRSIALELGRESDARGETQWLSKEKADHYRLMAADFESRAKRKAKPFAGGLTVSAKEARAEDPDLVQPAFTRDLQVEPDSGLVR